MKDLKTARAKHGRAIAAFDADGTLWNTDLGEALFDFQVRNKLLSGLPPDPWGHYQNLKVQVSHEVAYLWLAQINKGLPLKQVQEWAHKAVAEMAPVPVFKEVRALIDELHAMNVEVYIVTASIKWAVEPGAPLLGISPENVIGIRTRVVDGLVTDKQEGPITYKQGKVTGLLEATGGEKPFFCAGNTEGDLPLLESATDLRLVIAGSPENDRNYATERKMLAIAQDRGWYAQNYLA
ncbi:MAG: HAD family hydrolase [Bdellovibrionales bacterium]